MKRIIYFSLSLIAGVALAHPFPASAAENPKDKKVAAKGPPAHAGPVAHAAPVHAAAPVVHAAKPAFHPAVASHGPAIKPQVTQNNKTFNKNVNTNNVRSKNVATNQAVQPQAVQQNKTRNARTNNTTINQTQVVAGGGGNRGNFTRANNYGGRWSAGDSHHDWNRNQEHDWDGHHYRWYDGGWLVIDGGFWPVPGGYQGGGSLMAGAQQQLANAGYYNGPIDGVAGPGTRQAIANYQNDNNLPATGHLNEPTREALGLQ